MEYQDEEDANISETDWAKIESEIHDSEYEDSYPFRQNSLNIDIENVWHKHDHCYRKGTYYRGYRKRRMLSLLKLSNIRNKTVLDAGCGNGQHAVFLAIHGAEVHAVDLSAEGIRIGRKMAEANGVKELVYFYRQDLSQLAFDSQSFDLILYNAVLHHAMKYTGVADETKRVLKPGGRIVYAEGIRSNPVYKTIRSIYRNLTGQSGKGDVDISYKDVKDFGKGLEHIHEERFCLTLGIKELIGKTENNGPIRRTLFYILKRLDDTLLTQFSTLRRFTSETVGVFEKP